MVRLTSFLLLISSAPTMGFTTPRSNAAAAVQQNTGTALKESFGFDFAEDSYVNTPPEILGEANLKQWVGENIDNSFLNRQVSSFVCLLLIYTYIYIHIYVHIFYRKSRG